MKLHLTDIKNVTERIKLFTLTGPANGLLPSYTAGAHLDFDLGPLGTRSYSLIDFRQIAIASRAYQIAVQVEPDGDGGSLAMHALLTGDVLDVGAPKNSFELHTTNAPAILIAGGIGVTPMISFATALAVRGTPFHLHYAARSADVCAFADTLAADHGDALTLWLDDTNPIDLGQIINTAPADAHIYCCGPKGMIDAVQTIAEAAGHPASQLRFELFTTPEQQDDDLPFDVEINDGQVFTILPGQTIIEVLEAADIDVMYDCQRGDCGICQTDVLDGTPDHRDVVLSADERAAGDVMQICVSRAKSARLKLDI